MLAGSVMPRPATTGPITTETDYPAGETMLWTHAELGAADGGRRGTGKNARL
jgi:hypothetical protein